VLGVAGVPHLAAGVGDNDAGGGGHRLQSVNVS
jgi:hypothetical protein